jgi:hypothetical protein
MIVKGGQNIFDVTISETGNINNLFKILSENKINVDSQLISGQVISIPTTENIIEKFIISTIQNYQNITEYLIKSGQNIFDLSCQFFGNISYIFKLLTDSGLNISNQIGSGQKVIINNFETGNETVKKYVILNRLIFCNGSSNIYSSQFLETENEIIITTGDGQSIII